MRKTTKKKIAPIVITVLVIAYIAPLMAVVLGTMGLWSGGETVNVMSVSYTHLTLPTKRIV